MHGVDFFRCIDIKGKLRISVNKPLIDVVADKSDRGKIVNGG
jgi:hypothetical protein